MNRYLIKLKHRLSIPKSARWVLVGSVILVPSLLTAKSVAQSSNSQTGFIFEAIRELNEVRLTTIQYMGECPGESSPEVKAWFTSATTPPGEKRRVVIRNVTPGIDPDKQPYTDREYQEGTVSEATLIEFGTKHSSRRFHVIPGENEFQYEIKERENVIESGSFESILESDVKTETRNSSLKTEQVCASSSVSLSVCADVRTSRKWVCPGGSTIREELQPQGPVRTIISNQTFSPISYQVSDRIYHLEPGQDQTLTGPSLGSVNFADPNSGFTNSQYLTPGTRYRFTDSASRLELSEWYNR